jgi:FlaA1/EpsC-like NDP-sugar epimerase
MTRYFMTIPEAVQLIIRSGSLACGEPMAAAPAGADGRTPRAALGALANLRMAAPRTHPPDRSAAEVYVLDMGEPVSILELAREMIELSGLDPDRDIEIEIVGRRPGEKLHEDLFNSYERPRPTSAEKILLAEREPLGARAAESMFSEIGLLVLEGDAAGLAAKVSELSALHLEAHANGGRRRAQREPATADGRGERALDAPAALIHSPDS